MTIYTSNAQEQFDIITSHPRVILSKEAELSLQFLFLENEDAVNIQNSLRISAEQLVDGNKISDETIKKYIKEDKLPELFNEVSTLAMAFRLFEEQKYSIRLTEYLVAISDLNSWYSDNLYITSQLTMISGLGYDWLFYDLNKGDRDLIRNSIVQKGLNPGLKAMTENIDAIESDQMLAISSGFVLGGLAVADDFPDLNKKVVYRFLVNNKQTLEELTFTNIMEKYGDKWNENADDLAMVLSSLNISLGHDFKITSLENIKSFSSDYLQFLEEDSLSDQEKQNYILNPALLWFGKLNSNQEASDFYFESVKKYHIDASQKTPLNYMCLLWMI